MSEENKIFKILSEFISYEEKTFGGQLKYAIKYKQPNSQDPSRVWEHQAAESALSDDALSRLINASTGDRFCVHQGKDGKFPAIMDITDAKDAPAKGAGQGSKYGGKGGNYAPKDDSGIAIGAAVKDAIEVTRLAMELGVSVDEAWAQVNILTDTILTDKLAKEEKLRAAKKVAGGAVEAKAEEKPKSRAELLKEKQEAAAVAKPKAAKKVAPASEIEEEELAEQADDSNFDDDELDDVKF